MRLMAMIAAMLMLLDFAAAETVVRDVTWEENGDGAKLIDGGRPNTPAAELTLKVRCERKPMADLKVATLLGPTISSDRYAIRGQVRYESVEGDAALEMRCIFPDGSECVSRMSGSVGPIMVMSGTCADWRTFLIPVRVTQRMVTPKRIEIRLIMPGRGTIYLGRTQLVELEPTGVGATADRKLEAMIRQRENVRLQLQQFKGTLGDNHRTVKSLQSMLARLDKM